MHHSPNKYNQREKTNTHTKHIHENSEVINICVVKNKEIEINYTPSQVIITLVQTSIIHTLEQPQTLALSLNEYSNVSTQP